MASQPLSYLLLDELDLEGVRQQLAASNTLSEEAVTDAAQTFYDSFDWRVWQAGGELSHETGEPGQLCWIDRRNGESPACERIDRAPDFSDGLPPGPLRDHLAEVLEMRVLPPQVGILQKLRTLCELDNEEKTVPTHPTIRN